MSPNLRESELRAASDVDPLDAEAVFKPRSFLFERGLFSQLYPMLTELWQLLDVAAVGVALYAVTRWRGGSFGANHALLFVVTAALILFVYSWSDLFYRLRTRSFMQEMGRLLQAWTIVLILLMALAFLAQPDRHFSPMFALQWGIAGFMTQLAVHITVRKSIHFLRRRGYNIRSALIVGCGAPLERHVQLINRNPWLGIQIEGYVAEPAWLAEKDSLLTASNAAAGAHVQLRHLGGLSDIERLVDSLAITEIYVAMPLERSTDAERAMRALVNVPVNVDWLPDFSVAQVLSMRADQIDGQPIVLLSDSRIERHGRLVKRFEDILVSGFLILLLAPVLLAIAWLVKCSSPGPVFFKQSRHGMGGQRFVVWKFRTMRIEPQQSREKQATVGDDRVTPIGRLLRRWSLDELPQLFNVLSGQMSLVGPRPHPVWLNEAYAQVIERYMQRHRVKPGLTGWAQVNGLRGETDTREKMERRVNCDLYYITHWSPWFDLKILARTIVAVLRGDNAY
jgi:Undecaprenyl-phosphate glucose phosphotransferase